VNKHYQQGKILTYANSGSAIASGDVVLIGGGIGVAMGAIAATTGTGEVLTEEVVKLAKTTSQAWAQGQRLYWDTGTSKLTTAQKTTFAGIAAYAAGADATEGYVKLTPVIGPQAANVAFTAGENLTAVPGSFADEAAVKTYLDTVIAEIEARLDAHDTFATALLTSLKGSGLQASS
jgi:predicted RecA/RadA family phage recombinase